MTVGFGRCPTVAIVLSIKKCGLDLEGMESILLYVSDSCWLVD